MIGCGAVKARMRSAAIIKVQVAADRSAGLADVVVGSKVYLLIFYAAPQPLDEDIVPPSALPSMLIAIPLSASKPVNAWPVNWLP